MLASVLGISWATPILILAIYGMVHYFIRPDKAKADNGINWSGLETVGITVAIYLIAQFVGGLLIFLAALLRGMSIDQASSWLDKNSVGQFFLVLAIEAVTVALLYGFLKRRQSNFQNLGLKKPRWKDLAYVLLGFVIYFAAYILILAMVKQVVHINTDQPQQLGFDNASGGQLPLVFISLVILPPVVEELLVRGFLYSGLKKSLPIIWAAIVTSLIFAVAHLQAGSNAPLLWSAAIDTFILSLVLIYLKEKTGSLAACIGLHMLKNSIAFLGLFVFHLK